MIWALYFPDSGEEKGLSIKLGSKMAYGKYIAEVDLIDTEENIHGDNVTWYAVWGKVRIGSELKHERVAIFNPKYIDGVGYGEE